MNLTSIIKQPVLTEKSLQAASRGIFTFLVSPSANKDQIHQAVSQFYSVEVVSVHTQISKGKTYRLGRTRKFSTRPPRKIAFVQLKSGQTIDLFDIEESK